ncbi:MAG: DUF3631 domain-containing protein [Acidimicrobiales bacterium]
MTLIALLRDLEDSNWSRERLDPRSLAGCLRGFGVQPGNVRTRDGQKKGYTFEGIEAAYKRYGAGRIDFTGRTAPHGLVALRPTLPMSDADALAGELDAGAET